MHSFTTFLSLLITSSIVVLPLFPYTVFASHTGNRIHRRVELSFPHGAAHPLASSNVSLNTTNKFTTEVERKVLNKRGGSARFTWFNTGLGACGGTNSASDFIVAINKPQWDGGSHCYETVTLTYNGKSAQAQIVDECMGCPPNALDLSVGLFRFLVGPSQDEVMGDWSFGGEVKPSSTTTVEPTTSSTRTSHAVPTSTEAHTSTSVISTETSTTHRSSTVPFAMVKVQAPPRPQVQPVLA
ncbi:hypothetical protein BDQ17DRAFT_1403917 [Cyathus striatus]|nr:hypothetical protein BDQ17DRAFT_1403917 [Cyathus striatus]